ncbi:MAG: hypothetical protein CME63_16935 [Halobacteriovoraceae bacterium]|nr:hypothetical protein [Halobacteriovoraceae bacterium]|tara:strand:- start:47869 stop:49215 length:1347 start_codon:yes stop_codon:yes gene_type:complete
MPMGIFLNLYFSISNWLMEDALKASKYEAWQAHSQIVIVLSTGLLMWAYAILALVTIDSPIPAIVGFSAAAIHSLSPILLRYPGSIHMAAHTLIGAGLIHQGCFAYFTGGFNSNILIWFGILPMLGGIILGKKGVITWTIITASVSLVALYKMLYLSDFPMLISHNGWIVAQGFMIFGWIFLSSFIMYIFTALVEKNNHDVSLKATKIHTLVRVLCHDISNPLTTAKNRIKLIERSLGPDDQALKEKMSKLDRPLESIQGIIDQVRTWETIESGKKELELKPISIIDSILGTIDLFEEKIKEKDIILKTNLPHDDMLILADRVTFQSQILSNILSNAIKFSNKGESIEISVDEDIVKREDHQDHFIKLKIADHGVGIPEEILKDLFDPSKKTNRAGTLGEAGTGFGMPIVKAYVEKFNGKINVISQTQNNAGPTGTIFEMIFQKANYE